jgi:hypothetical protein
MFVSTSPRCRRISLVAAAIFAGCMPSSDRGVAPPAEPVGPSLPVRDGSPQPEPPAPVAATAPPASSAPDKRPPGRRVRKPFDPIRDNGPIFVDWPAPKLAIVVTGRQNGYLEPCGCAGLDRMRGGLARRQTMIESLRAKGWPVAILDVGGLSQRAGPQALLKFYFSVEAMTEMGYDAIGLGTAELRFPAAELLAPVAGDQGRPGRFVSANVGLFGPPGKIAPQKRIVEAGGLKLGVTSVLGKKYQREIHNPDVEMTDPEAALARVLPELRSACDLTVLLANATREESAAFARRFPELDVVVIADGPPVPPAEPTQVEGGKTLLVEVGERVKDAIVLGVFDDPKQPLRYQRAPLDSRFAPSAGMKARMADYQEQLRQLGLDGLGVRPAPHPRREVLGDFVGPQKCAACHETQYDAWKKTGHAKAMQTLAGLDPPRQFDPECIACHATGWHPQGCFPYESGYLGPDSTPKLAAVGCENCHGPGGTHAAAEAGADELLKEKLQAALRLTQADAQRQVCPRCHDVTNSPDFEFDAYWPDVTHAEDE